MHKENQLVYTCLLDPTEENSETGVKLFTFNGMMLVHQEMQAGPLLMISKT